MACFNYVAPKGSSDTEGWYNPLRPHSVLGYRAPMTYEALNAARHD